MEKNIKVLVSQERDTCDYKNQVIKHFLSSSFKVEVCELTVLVKDED